MNNAFFEICYRSLGEILNNLYSDQQIQSSEILLKKLTDAIKFHAEMRKELDAMLSKNREIAQKLAEFQSGAVADTDRLLKLRDKYQILRSLGANTEVIFELFKYDNVVEIDRIKMMATIFNVDWDEAKTLVNQLEKAQPNG